MQRILILLVIFSLKHLTSSGQPNPEWVLKDDSLIAQVKNVVLTSPLKIETYFKINGYQRSTDSLGFNWVKTELTVAGGYITFYANFYYLEDTLKTIILWSNLPHENSISEHYFNSFISFLPIDSGHAYYYKYRPENILRPLPEYSLVKNQIDLSFEVQNYMSPSSGLYYGYRGGITGSVLPNRKAFKAIKRTLTQNVVLAIMYSINPASRLTAIEFFIKNKSHFKMSKEIQNWINLVYSEKPKIETMNGCLISRESSASLVQIFVKSSSK